MNETYKTANIFYSTPLHSFQAEIKVGPRVTIMRQFISFRQIPLLERHFIGKANPNRKEARDSAKREDPYKHCTYN